MASCQTISICSEGANSNFGTSTQWKLSRIQNLGILTSISLIIPKIGTHPKFWYLNPIYMVLNPKC